MRSISLASDYMSDGFCATITGNLYCMMTCGVKVSFFLTPPRLALRSHLSRVEFFRYLLMDVKNRVHLPEITCRDQQGVRTDAVNVFRKIIFICTEVKASLFCQHSDWYILYHFLHVPKHDP